MMDRQGIEVDYCPRCRGVWLDRGELEKLIDHALAAKGRNTLQRHPDDSDDDDDERDRKPEYHNQPKHKKRGSWLSEIFDFD